MAESSLQSYRLPRLHVLLQCATPTLYRRCSVGRLHEYQPLWYVVIIPVMLCRYTAVAQYQLQGEPHRNSPAVSTHIAELVQKEYSLVRTSGRQWVPWIQTRQLGRVAICNKRVQRDDVMGRDVQGETVVPDT